MLKLTILSNILEVCGKRTFLFDLVSFPFKTVVTFDDTERLVRAIRVFASKLFHCIDFER